MDDTAKIIIALVVGILIGIAIALLFMSFRQPLGYVFERDERGLIRAVYAVPAPSHQ